MGFFYHQWLAPTPCCPSCARPNTFRNGMRKALLLSHVFERCDSWLSLANWDINSLMDLIFKHITPVWSEILHAATEGNESKIRMRRVPPVPSHVNVVWYETSCMRPFSWLSGLSGTKLYQPASPLLKITQFMCLMASFQWSISSTHQHSKPFPPFDVTRRTEQYPENDRGLRHCGSPHSCFGATHLRIRQYQLHWINLCRENATQYEQGPVWDIYEMPNARVDDTKVESMVQNLLKAFPLRLTDLQPSQLSMQLHVQKTAFDISKILCEHVEGFASYLTYPQLQNIPRRKLPPGYKTRFFPHCELVAST